MSPPSDPTGPAPGSGTLPTSPPAEGGPAPAPPLTFGRFEAREELGRGGMGAVYRAYDPVLTRDVAVKALLAGPGERPDLEQRFLNEARVGARLQHPGLAPVYELGRTDDGRPFLVMKLVQGRTLADLLAERPAPAERLAHFLGVFEQVCQAVGYAHSRGVIHRDLKPANVMVGEHGEVQVMDWGLARLLPVPGACAADAGGLSAVGMVLGTAAYMAPEQARGEVDLHDARADVFGLGSMLCELLTGQPAFPGPGWQALARAALADLSDAFARLDGPGVDAELAALARACLCPERDGRPADAAVVALRLADYRAGVAERLRRAELARAVAEDVAQAEAAQREQRWDDAWAWLRRAEGRIDHAGGDPALREGLRQARVGLEQVRKDRSMAARLDEAMFQSAAAGEGGFDEEGSLRSYEAAFAWYASPLELHGAATDELAALVAASAIRERLLVALDHWDELAQMYQRGYQGRLALLTCLADADPFRRGLREALRRHDWPEVVRRADGADVAALAPAHVVFLANVLRAAGEWARAEEALRRGQLQHPDDFLLNFTLARTCAFAGAERAADAARYFTAVLALCPRSVAVHIQIGVSLRDLGRHDEAAAFFSKAVALRPDYAEAHNHLGLTLRAAGRPREAVAAFREAARLRPNYVDARLNLGLALADSGDTRMAVHYLREAARLEPFSFTPHFELGKALACVGLLPEAEEACRQACRIKQDSGPAHTALALALHGRRKHAEAAVAFQEALRLDRAAVDPPSRYAAACSAALAGCGRAPDAACLGAARRWELRDQALRWLSEDLAAWAARLATGAPDTPGLLRSTVGAWQADPQLDCVRGPDALAALPSDERQEWRRLWESVADLLRRAAPPSPS
jgi:serine/threonine-protein kinase